MSVASSVKGPCPYCQIPQRDQHSLRESGICDAKRRPSVKVGDETMVKVPRVKQSQNRRSMR